MKLRRIQDADVAGKRVLLRVEFNVALDERGDVREKYKIAAAKESLEHLRAHGASVVALLAHLGRPDGKILPTASLQHITDDMQRILGIAVRFVPSCVGADVDDAVGGASDGDVLLLENVRFHAEEEKNDADFARRLAAPFDLFVNDAFAACHRAHASIVGITKYLPSFAGIQLQKEVDVLEKVIAHPEHPAVAIIGGAKISTKVPLIDNFEKNYDHILVGGKTANEALDEHITFGKKVILPHDFATARYDIGPQTIALFSSFIEGARTVVWNGPMGKFEEKPYDTGTRAILDAILRSKAFSVVGGGESVQALEEAGAVEKISFVSTGGGAMLSFLGGEVMPGIDALRMV